MRPPSGERSWPAELRYGPVLLRPLRRSDARAWRAVRAANSAWLSPWDATDPDHQPVPVSYGAMLRSLNRAARGGRALPFVLEHEGQLAGQVTASGIQWGSLRSANIGYWISRSVAGRGLMPLAVALVVDHCFFTVGLHRVEVNIRPENQPSLRVAEKLGLRPEGLRRRFLHIDGGWRDHLGFALTVEDVPQGLLHRLTHQSVPPPGRPAPGAHGADCPDQGPGVR